MKFSSTEPKFDISIKNITGKNTFLNSKNAFLYLARLFRPWVISAQAVSAPIYFNFVDLFILNRRRGKQKLTSVRVRFFYLFISKTKKSSVQSVIQLRTHFFFLKK